jgi:hypothetical protein
VSESILLVASIFSTRKNISSITAGAWRRLLTQPKSQPIKLALAARLRQETTLSVKRIADGLRLGEPKAARTNLHKFKNPSQCEAPEIQLDLQ